MKDKLKKIVRCIVCTGVFFALLIFSWRYLSNRMELKNSHVKYDDFLAGGNGEDVLFFGSSHMINAVFPDMLWKNYGITSYNLANHGELLPTSYEVFRNALNYSSPEVVVVDLFCVSQNDTYYNKSFSHISLDAFPLTWTKLNSVNVLFDDLETKCEFLSNFCLYHTRWDEYLTLSPEYTPSVMKGAELRVNVELAVGELAKADAMDNSAMTDGLEAVMRFKELCDEKGIKLICVNLPYSGYEERYAFANYAELCLEKAGIPYLDFMDESCELKLNPQTDFFDTNHLNPLGGRKITEYLGAYLTKECGVQDRSGSEYAKKWNSDVVLSSNERMKQLKEQADKRNYINALMMMKANKARGIIVITPYLFLRNREVIMELLEQMGFDVSGIDALGSNSAWVGVYDEEKGIASSQLVNEKSNFELTDYVKNNDTFYLKYMEPNHFGCSYNGEDEIYLHNQMMMIYLFDDSGNLLTEQGFIVS